MKKPLTILGIDTSCDDTSIAVVRGLNVLSNVISSQDAVHKAWGGVVPMLAQREHEKNWDSVLQTALKRAQVTPQDIDAIAVTFGPGLAPALEVGVEKSQVLAQEWQKPIVPINHVEGHLWSSLLQTKHDEKNIDAALPQFPVLGVIVSGNHTEIVLVRGIGQYEILGETVDDAFGEAFDKVARMLDLGYPGGALLAKLADAGNEKTYPLPVAMRQSGDLNVSYSGLKTATFRLVQTITQNGEKSLTIAEIQDIAASFQRAAVLTLMGKFTKAIQAHAVHAVFLGGGAAANLALRKALRAACTSQKIKLHVAKNSKYIRDNGAMIAGAAALRVHAGVSTLENKRIDRVPQARLRKNEFSY